MTGSAERPVRRAVVFVLCGALLIAAAALGYLAVQGHQRDAVVQNGAKAVGEFVSVETVHGYKARVADYAWYVFEVDGKTYQVRDHVETRTEDKFNDFPDRFVHYMPDNPADAVVGDWTVENPRGPLPTVEPGPDITFTPLPEPYVRP